MKGGRSKTESKKAAPKLSVKKGGGAAGKKPVKKGKAVKDTNKPKRPASAFFIFMEDFRKQYKEKHPNNKYVAAAGGDKWKSLSEAEIALFVAKADKRKAEYEKTLQAYNKRMNEGAGTEEEEKNKSRSEINDENDDEDGSDELRIVRAVAVLGGLLQIIRFICLCGIIALVLNECVKAEAWLREKLQQQDSLPSSKACKSSSFVF